MKVIYDSKNFDKKIKNPVIACGNFDGVHLGHQAIIQKAREDATKKDGTLCIYTFHPHPTKVLAPKGAPSLIQTEEQKNRALEENGVEICIIESFTKELSKLSPHDFFKIIIQKNLHPTSLWVGYDFTFGIKRSGNVKILNELCEAAKIALHVVDAQFFQETLVRSTQIRQSVREGDVTTAKELLGRPFGLLGTVVKGHGIGGEKLGIHTANLKVENELLPAVGIYITQTKTEEEIFPSATSVGYNPTFREKEFSVETHLIGFQGDLYGKKIEIQFLKWLREEKTFDDTDALAKAIQNDILETKKYHGLSI